MDKKFWSTALVALVKMFVGLSLLVGFAFMAGLALRIGAKGFLLGWRGSW